MGVKVTVCGPNLSDQSKGSYHVHAEGCGDLVRGAAREPEYRHGWTIEAESQVDVAEAVFEDIIAEQEEGETGEAYLGEFHFFPCCAGLPVKGAG